MSITERDLLDLPKAELHCHLGGSFDPAILQEAEKRGYQTPIRPDELEAIYPVRCYADFARWHAVGAAVRNDFALLKLFLELHIERLKAQNVIYAEIMVGTRGFEGRTEEFVRRGRELRAIADAVSDDIEVALVESISTEGLPEYAEELAGPILDLYGEGVIDGVDWLGSDLGHSLVPFRRTLDRFREAGAGITIHAGEWAGPEFVRDAIERGHANRIGHGVAIFRDPGLLRLFQEQQIHIELCPTSNLKTGVFDRIEDHPLRKALDLGLNFSINTDDPGTFECSVESEYRLAAQVFAFREEDLRRATANAIGSRFRRFSDGRGRATSHYVADRR